MGFISTSKDSRLVRRALASDSAAFAELVRRHMPGVSAVAMAYTKNHADADDVAQEAFLKAWQALDTLREPRRFGGWVVTIARNVARKQFNQKRRDADNLVQYESEIAMSPIPPPSNDDSAMERALPGFIAALLATSHHAILGHA